MQYIFELPTDKTFEERDQVGFAYSDIRDNANIDATKVFSDGYSGDVYTGQYDRVYLVLAGSGQFTVERETFAVTKDNVIVLPQGTTYSYNGVMELFCVNTPAFKE